MSLKDLYDKNVNIMEYFRERENTSNNTLNSIMTSYDQQAGSYIKDYEDDNESDNYHINNERISLKSKVYKEKFITAIKDVFDKFDYSTVLEAGVGEATTLNFIIEKCNKNAKYYGFDLAPSRIMQGQRFLKKYNNSAELIVGNLLQTPYEDNAFDIVYTVHSIEPNTDKASDILKELYRITNKYLILIEPCYELGNEETKKNIDKHKYIKNLKAITDSLGYKIIEYKLFPIGTYANQPQLLIIEKNAKAQNKEAVKYCCPICQNHLVTSTQFGEVNYFCKECLVVYPVLKNVPLLTKEHAILFTQYLE